MYNLLNIQQVDDIPEKFRTTPIADLLVYHNAKQEHKNYTQAQILIGMCMDHRKNLNIPQNFAYIIRTGGANLRVCEFNVSYAIAVAEVKHIALIGHTQCGMVNLMARKEQFIKGLCKLTSWDQQMANDHFNRLAPMFEIGNEVDFVLSETKRLSIRYPNVTIAPLLYKVEDNRLYWIEEK